jgi:hypothetical protein
MSLRKSGVSLFAIWVLVGSSTALAQAEPELPGAVGVRVAEFSLERLMSRSEQVMLQSATDRYVFSIPLSPRVRVRKATLELVFTNSISLLEPRSQLRVSLNGKVLAQTLLQAAQPERVMRVNLPPEIMELGYNELELQASQHYADKCEDPTASELWTHIDTNKSRLRFEYVRRPVDVGLAAIPKMVDPLGWEPYRLTILTPSFMLEEADLKHGANLGAGLASLLKYRPLQLAHAGVLSADAITRETAVGRVALIGNDAETDAILLGTADELAPFLPTSVVAEIDGPYIGITRHVADRTRFVLVISGLDSDEVTVAAEAFALAGESLPEVSGMTVRDVVAPEITRYANTNAIQSDQRYPFSGFGVKTTTLGGSGSEYMDIELWVPPDLFVPADSSLQVHLHMAYGAGSDATSVVNVELNERFASAIRLVDVDGGVFRDYVVPLPASWLQPGTNTLRFRAHMTPVSEGDICFAPSGEALLASIFDDSWLLLSDAQHHVELPDLQLMARTGFPFSSPADGSELHVRTTSLDGDTVASAWMLLGKLTQLSGIAPWKATIGTDPAPKGRHEIIVGPVAELPEPPMDAAPVQFGENGLLKSEILRMPRGRNDSRLVKSFFPAGQGLANQQTVVPALASVGYAADLDERSYLIQYESPVEAGRLVTVVTSMSSSALRQAVARLVEFDLWGSLYGDLAVWTPTLEAAETSWVGDRFHLGEADLQSRANFFFSERPWVWIGMLIVAALIFAFTSAKLLGKRARHQS